MATRTFDYTGTPVTGTGGLTSLATSSTHLAGYEWYVIDNTTDKAPYRIQTGKITVGTTPTASTEIRIYLIPSYDGSTWPDVFDGTPSAETVTSEGVRDGFAVLAKRISVDATTSNREYPFFFEVSSVLNGPIPKKCGVFVAHNTGVNLNGTASNHAYQDTPIWDDVS